MVVLDPHRPPERVLQVQCEDCLSFYVGVLDKHVQPRMFSGQLAMELSDHMRNLRGYEWSVSGYHAGSASLWLTAAYYSCGIFLISGERDSKRATNLDCLIHGFKHNVVKPADPRMLQVQSYRTHDVYLDMSKPIVPVNSVQDILSSPQCSASYGVGRRAGASRSVTVAEFLPFASVSAGKPRPAGTPARQAAGRARPRGTRPVLRLGDRCPTCGEVVKERASLTETFIGCMC